VRRWLALLVVVAALGAACTGPGDKAVGRGASVPRRVVSLVPAATEMLFAMGAGPRVVAVSSFDHFPPAVERLPRVGALLDPDIERIITLEPDLVIAFEGQSDLREKLSQAGIDVFAYPRPTLAGIFDTVRSLGKRLGLGPRAEEVAAAMETQLDAVRTSVEGRPRPRTLLVIGRDPGTLRNVYASGGVGFLNDALTIAGGRNVFSDVARENLQVTTESILAAQPDAIVEVVAARPWSAAEIEREKQVWSALASVPAVRTGRVYLLVGDEFVIPGPRVAEAARRFAAALHPGVRANPGRM
jgi:iron complex transport system substrate-binding protein